jgi:2-keto-4-pentenoate hydratase
MTETEKIVRIFHESWDVSPNPIQLPLFPKQSLRPAYRVSNEHIEMKIATQPQDVGHRVFLTKHYRLQS